ncbi:histone deacetylase [Rhodothermaceae bacterium RA]|nr:histone deacetylase [Rhodothermaceae bacterium RA]
MTTAFATTPSHALHARPGHVERPERLDAVLTRLRADPAWDALQHVAPLPVDLDVTRLVHSDTYLRRLVEASREEAALDPDTYTTHASVAVALETLGAVLAVTQAVLEGRTACGFAATRPPGHHATPDRAMGFCLLSNVALAARWAEDHFGVERTLIVDFDVHHGNGTQEVFYEDPNVLFLSVHQHPLYPGTGAAGEVGHGRGEGTTVNVPLPPRTGRQGYLDAFRRLLEPVVARFRPEWILVSAGYDAHWQDPLGAMHLDAAAFGALMQEVMAWADAHSDGRLVAVLEGGYHADALADSVQTTVRMLLDPEAGARDAAADAPDDAVDVRGLIRDLAHLHGV